MKVKKIILIFFAYIVMSFVLPGDKMPYQLFDVKGKVSAYDKMLKEIIQKEKPDMIFFGELHDDAICHWIEVVLAEDIYAAYKDKLVMGAEMFESDDQLKVNEYVSGMITEKTFADEAKVWSNYKTDYKPLIDFAKAKKIPFVATNVPRRYANMVYNKGLAVLDSIDSLAKKFMAPIPIRFNEHLKCYEEITKAAGGHNSENLAKSQAIKDATMAHFIMKNWNKGKLFLHYNGTYHSDNNEGIVWYLKQEKPDLKIIVISCVEQPAIVKLDKESIGIANYVLCVTDKMTRTQ